MSSNPRQPQGNSPLRRLLSLVRQDLRRYFELDSRDGAPGTLEKVRMCMESPGLQAVLVYRFGSWVRDGVRVRAVRLPCKVAYAALHKLCTIMYGIHIDVRADIGGGLYIGHFGGILIGPARIGSDCNVAHNVTIGRRADRDGGVPVLGERVWIGTGSVVFGGVTIGDGVTVAPLSVVSRSIPAKMLVVGNPARVVRYDYDNSMEVYGHTRPVRAAEAPQHSADPAGRARMPCARAPESEDA